MQQSCDNGPQNGASGVAYLTETKVTARPLRASTEVPTGFNHTTHNCNNAPDAGGKKKRPPGRCCGKYTLIGAKDGKYKHHRFRCKSYTCGICGPKKIRMVRKRIAQRAVENKLTRFLTLTLDPKKLKPGMTLEYLIVHRGGRGQSYVYELNWSGSLEEKSGGGRVQVGGTPVGGRGADTRMNIGPNAVLVADREKRIYTVA
jgi:hypothetical protein